MSQIECVIDAKAKVGECPVWHPGEEALYWVDILAPALYRYDPKTGAQRTWELPEAVGSFALREKGGAVLALRSGLYAFDFGTAKLELIARPEPDRPGNRLNDGKTSPDGRFFVGSMDDRPEKEPIAALHRLDPDGTCTRVAEGYTVSNGLAWSADGKTMIHTDSRQKQIDLWDYDMATGNISNRRTIANPTEEIGRPDGGATDIEGGYWSAGVSAGKLNRWLMDGTLDRVIDLPVRTPTMPCFAGKDMKTLYLTSLRPDANPSEQAGGLFRMQMDVAGTPIPFFKG